MRSFDSYTYRMVDSTTQTPWPERISLGLDGPGAQLFERLRRRVRYGGRKGRRAASRLAKLREGLFG